MDWNKYFDKVAEDIRLSDKTYRKNIRYYRYCEYKRLKCFVSRWLDKIGF